MNKEKILVFSLLTANFFLGNYDKCLELLKTAPLLEKAFKRKPSPMYNMLYPVQTCLSLQELSKLDKACEKKGLSRYEFVRKAIMEKVERDRKPN